MFFHENLNYQFGKHGVMTARKKKIKTSGITRTICSTSQSTAESLIGGVKGRIKHQRVRQVLSRGDTASSHAGRAVFSPCTPGWCRSAYCEAVAPRTLWYWSCCWAEPPTQPVEARSELQTEIRKDNYISIIVIHWYQCYNEALFYRSVNAR